jgi:hypothetical protein
MARFVNSDRYTVEFDQTWAVQTTISAAIQLFPVLCERQWSLLLPADGTPDLICSDWPVGLMWTVPEPGPYPPGFGMRGTVLTVPLTRRLALASSFEEMAPTQTASEEYVAAINARTALQARRVFSAEAAGV